MVRVLLIYNSQGHGQVAGEITIWSCSTTGAFVGLGTRWKCGWQCKGMAWNRASGTAPVQRGISQRGPSLLGL